MTKFYAGPEAEGTTAAKGNKTKGKHAVLGETAGGEIDLTLSDDGAMDLDQTLGDVAKAGADDEEAGETTAAPEQAVADPVDLAAGLPGELLRR